MNKLINLYTYSKHIGVGIVFFLTIESSISQNILFKQYIIPIDTAFNDFGKSLSIDNQKFVVGSRNETTDSNNVKVTGAGAAYVYTVNSDTWFLEQKITAPYRSSHDFCAETVYLKNAELLIGCPQGDKYLSPSSQIKDIGSVLYYVYKNGKWQYSQTLFPSDGNQQDHMGRSIARVNDDLLVHSNGHDFNEQGLDSMPLSGAVYYYQKIGNQWIEKQKIVGPDRMSNDFLQFGNSLYLNQDYSNQLYIGSSASTDEMGINNIPGAGAVYFYNKNLASNKWEFKQKLVANDRGVSEGFGYFDGSIFRNNDFLFIGSASNLDENGTDSITFAGGVYIFEFNSLGEWEIVQKIVSPHRQERAEFGRSIWASDSLLVIGSPRDETDENNSTTKYRAGGVYFYKLNTQGKWEFFRKLVPTNRSETAEFGFKVAMQENILIITAYQDEVGLNIDMGSVYYYYIDTQTGIGIYELNDFTDVVVYPNPTSDIITVGGVRSISSVHIFDNMGRIVNNLNLDFHKPNQVSVNINHLKAGKYYVQIIDQTGKAISKSIIKQ